MRAPRYSTALLERPATDVEFGASQAAFELRYGLRPPREEASAASATTPSEGRQLVNSAAISALTNPLCHTTPEDDLGELLTVAMKLPTAQRSMVRTIVWGMRRSVAAKPSLIFALVAFMATLGLGLNTDVGRAAAHTVVETTREVGRAVVKRAADAVAPAVRQLRHTTTGVPRQKLGVGPSATPRSVPPATKTAAKPTARTVSPGGTAVRVLAVSTGRTTDRAGQGHHRHQHVAHNAKHAEHSKHATGHEASHARAGKHAKHGTHAKHGKSTSKRSGRHR